jgi:putative transposase
VARYGQGFKDRAVARLLPPESASAEEISREVGVGVDTLERWRSEALSRPARERAWTAAARFDAVLTTAAMADKPVLHGDNGSTLKATTVLAMLYWLGIKPSYSRPRVSDDNPHIESLFRTAKYRPEFPANGFADLNAAREWAAHFVRWYNFDHRHSGIRYVSPAQRHAGHDQAILAARHEVYIQARERNPARWSRDTRNWTPIGAVTLNPERDTVAAASNVKHIQSLAA